MYHRLGYNHPLADPLPNPFPFELLLQKASDLEMHTAQASSGGRTFLRPRPIFVLSCDFRSAARPIDLSCRRKRMALSAADSGSDAGSMDAEARMSRGESRKRCGESARQLLLAASRSPRRCDFALYPVSYCSWLEWKSNQGTKSDRELHVRGDPWTVSAPGVGRAEWGI